MISCGWLSLATPLIFKKLFLLGTCMHTHTLDLIYIPSFRLPSLTEIEFTLGDFNFLSDETPS